MFIVFPLTDQDDATGEDQAGTSSIESEAVPRAQRSERTPRVKSESSKKDASQNRGAIAETVNRMKTVLSPPKLTPEGKFQAKL